MRLQAESKKKQAIPVRFTLKGKVFKANIVRYLGDWRLYLNGPMLKSTAVGVGDKVSVTLRYDPVPRRTPMPPALAKAFTRDRRAQMAFAALAPSRQKEILRYLGSLKREESLMRNVQRTLRHLKGLKTDASPTGLYRAAKGRSGRQ